MSEASGQKNRAPCEIPGYHLGKLLGEGGVGSVYLATDADNGRDVAIKILPLDDQNPTRTERFLQEADVSTKLDHPDIIRVFGFGTVPRFGWIAMEVLDGYEFGEAMSDESLGFEDRVNILIRVALALAHAHARGVVHRDVKPSNVFMTKSGDVRLLDFGIAKTDDAKITRTGFIVGTPQYMAPEQISAVQVDGRADQFSLGVVAYEAFANERPWTGENVNNLMMAICTSPPEPFSKTSAAARFRLDAKKAEQIHQILHKAISQEPRHRFASITEFADALRRMLDGRYDDEPSSEVEIDPRAWQQRRIDWAVARAARLGIEEDPRAAVQPVQHEEEEEDRSTIVWFALVLLFSTGIAAAWYVLSA